MFGATILVPLLVNEAAGATVLTIPVTLVMSGIGTLVYILCTKGKSPVYLGSSFASDAKKPGFRSSYFGILSAGKPSSTMRFSMSLRVIKV